MQNAGPEGSLTAVLAENLPYLRRYARALTGQQQRGDAYAAATLEAILEDSSVFEGDTAPKLGLFKTFHSIWSTTGGRVAAPHEADDPLEVKAQSRLAALTPNTREAVLLNTMEGFLEQDVAFIMGVSEGEAQERLKIGLAEMADEMKSRVMIIEDEPIIAMDIQSIVSDTGHNVIGIARTRDEAVAMAGKEAPDLLLADVQLADGSSGIDAAQDILAKYPDLPVVFITAYPERLLTGNRPEPAFLITKPFTQEQVRLAVSQSLFFSSSEVLA